jgi:hypothetical protein
MFSIILSLADPNILQIVFRHKLGVSKDNEGAHQPYAKVTRSFFPNDKAVEGGSLVLAKTNSVDIRFHFCRRSSRHSA